LKSLNFSTGGVHCINLYQLNQIIYHLLIKRILSVGGFYFVLKRLETCGFRGELERLVSALRRRKAAPSPRMSLGGSASAWRMARSACPTASSSAMKPRFPNYCNEGGCVTPTLL